MMADLRVAGRRRQMGEDVDPAVGLINLADIMLVFATGLMMAIISFWQVDISQVSQVVESSQIAEVDNLEDARDLLESGGAAYSQIGTVYEDPVTGTLYMLKEDLESTGGALSSLDSE
jgi:hypothetical protein